MDGILNFYKDSNMTSNDAVIKLRKLLGEKKLGHTGTLDPNATGLLPMCFGRATRLIEYMESAKKTYICKCRFGFDSDTLDVWGQTEEKPLGACVLLDEKDPEEIKAFFEDIFKTFLGKIQQIPPKYSAIWINGRRAYDMARSGEDFAMESRSVEINELKFFGYSKEEKELSFEVTCSKGTYIRSLCRDIAQKMNTFAVMTQLTRTRTCGLLIEDSLSFERIASMSRDEIEEKLLPLSFAVSSLARVDIPTQDRRKAFCNGLSFYLNKDRFAMLKASVNENFAVMDGDLLLGIAKVHQEEDRFVFVPEKVIPK